MKRLILSAVAAMLMAANAQACGGLCFSCCPPPVCVSYIEQTVKAYRPVMKERMVEVTVLKPTYRDVIQTHKCVELVATYKDVKSKAITMKTVAVPVTQEVARCVNVPVVTIDPCTCCPVVCCKPVMVMEKVCCMALKCVPEEIEITQRVCQYVPVERSFQTKYTVCECVPVKEMRKECYCELEPVAIKVCVPVVLPVCCDPCCP